MCAEDIRRYASAMAVAQGTMPDTPPVSFDQNLAAQAGANVGPPSPPPPKGQKNIYDDSMSGRGTNGQ